MPKSKISIKTNARTALNLEKTVVFDGIHNCKYKVFGVLDLFTKRQYIKQRRGTAFAFGISLI